MTDPLDLTAIDSTRTPIRPGSTGNAFTGYFSAAGGLVNAARKESIIARVALRNARKAPTQIPSTTRDPDARSTADKNRALRKRAI